MALRRARQPWRHLLHAQCDMQRVTANSLVALGWHARDFHAGAVPEVAAQALSASVVAAQPVEPMLLSMLNPLVLGTQAWEAMHAATGLPWWASIPLTTLAMRGLLLPFTVKAKAATVNFALLQLASNSQSALAQQMGYAEQPRRRGAAAVGDAQPPPVYGTTLQRMRLASQYYRYLRRLHRSPSLWWYNTNAILQLFVFVTMSASLRQMAGALWPGFVGEGIPGLEDLTLPSVQWGTLATPFGINGVFLPLAILGAYYTSVGRVAAAHTLSVRVALEAMMVPLFVASMSVPQATVLYWLTNNAFNAAVQQALAAPLGAAAAGLPLATVQATGGEQGGGGRTALLEQQLLAGGAAITQDASFLHHLADVSMRRKRWSEAAHALARATAVDPSDAGAWDRAGVVAGELGRWQEAGRAHDRAAALLADDARRQGAAFLRAGTAWLNAAAEATRAVRDAGGEAPAAAPAVGGGGDKAAQGGGSSAAVCLQAATLSLTKATERLPGDPHAWYQLALARMATQRPQSALEAATKAWDVAGAGAASDATSQQQLAPQLLPLAIKLLGSCSPQAGATQQQARVLAAARLAAAAAATGSSAQQREQLERLLQQASEAAASSGLATLADELRSLSPALPAGSP